MAQFWLKLGVRRVVIPTLLANLVGIQIIFMFHKPAALHLQSILDNFNSHLGMDTSTAIPQLSFWEYKILGDLLKKASMPNKTVILTPLNHAWDADILWFRNPFTQLVEDFDVQMAVDHLTDANTGFIYVLSNNRTISLFKIWYDTRERQLGIHEQDNFQKMLQHQSVQDIGLKLSFLDVNIFSGHCQGSNNWLQICTMHANCCIGLGDKMEFLRIAFNIWKQFKALPLDEKNKFVPNW
ncbi:unnamed protein product [Sphagnum jensenii]|uniref:Nucleotide-diphospho-sugar transferase domain-containing protein n=1 Tax=Sphagnum jensenii TaxID=128206 RepID=A0ABP0WW22_9BRYO